jgi:hypothetical protein
LHWEQYISFSLRHDHNFSKNAAAQATADSTNHDTRFMIDNYNARSISLVAGNGSIESGSFNVVVCAHVMLHWLKHGFVIFEENT